MMNRFKLKFLRHKILKKIKFLRFHLILLIILIIFISQNYNIKYSIPQSRLSLYNYDTNLSNELIEFLNKNCNIESVNVDCLLKLNKFEESKFSSTLKDDCEKCFYFKNDSNNKEKLIIYHHTFWQLQRINETIDEFNLRVIKLNLMSYLATQNLCCTRFILWKLKEFPFYYENELNKTFSYYIRNGVVTIKEFDLNQLCSSLYSSFKYTIICYLYKYMELSNSRLVALSDLVRFMVIELYGGIYTDGDVVYLKDMRSLWDHNFAYRWSTTNNLNTAVLGINRNINPDVFKLYDYVLNRYSITLNGFFYLFHPYKISNAVIELNNGDLFSYKSFRVFNCLLFDPGWVCDDIGWNSLNNTNYICEFSDFNKKSLNLNESKIKPNMFYSGAYTYHLHLKNLGFTINDLSYFKLFENYYASILNLTYDFLG